MPAPHTVKPENILVMFAFVAGCAQADDADADVDSGQVAWEVQAATAVARFNPVADAKVQQNKAATNFGGLTRLEAGSSPVTRSYLRFDVSNVVGTVTSARLRLWINDGTSDGPALHRTSSSWGEQTLTWNNQPGPLGAAVLDVGAVSRGVWL